MSEHDEPIGTTRPNHLWRSRYQNLDRPYRPWREIAQEVASRHGLTVERLIGPERVRCVSWPRQEAWAMIWAQGRLSLPAIGRRFGGRDHTTVLHGIRRYEGRVGRRASDS